MVSRFDVHGAILCVAATYTHNSSAKRSIWRATQRLDGRKKILHVWRRKKSTLGKTQQRKLRKNSCRRDSVLLFRVRPHSACSVMADTHPTQRECSRRETNQGWRVVRRPVVSSVLEWRSFQQLLDATWPLQVVIRGKMLRVKVREELVKHRVSLFSEAPWSS